MINWEIVSDSVIDFIARPKKKITVTTYEGRTYVVQSFTYNKIGTKIRFISGIRNKCIMGILQPEAIKTTNDQELEEFLNGEHMDK